MAVHLLSLCMVLIFLLCRHANAQSEELEAEPAMEPAAEPSPPLVPIYIGGEVPLARPLKFHVGNEFNNHFAQGTGETINYGTDPHNGILWINNGRYFDIYDITDFTRVKLIETHPSSSECIEPSTLFMSNKGISTVFIFHDDTLYCSCEWSEDNPCPALLRVETLDESTGNYTTYNDFLISGNNRVPILSVDPAVTADSGVESLSSTGGNSACAPLTNDEAVSGSYCISYRGGCTFQDKYENCLDAGAVAGIVINSIDVYTTMPVVQIDPDFPFMFMTSSDGEELLSILGSEDSVRLSSGDSIAPTEPMEGFSDGSPFTAFNITNNSTIPLDEPPFSYVLWAAADDFRDLIYVLDREDTYTVLNVTDVVTGESSSYDVLGTFSVNEISFNSDLFDIFHQEATGISVLNGAQGNSGRSIFLSLFDLTNPISPTLMSQIKLDDIYCPELSPSNWVQTVADPKGEYLYVNPNLYKTAESPDCPYPISVYNIKDLYNPKLIGSFTIPGVMPGNFVRLHIGSNGVGAVRMENSGILFYDFSDPAKPERLTDILKVKTDAQTAAETPYLVGVIDAQEGLDGQW